MPSGESALPAELAQLRRDRQQRVVGRLVGQVVELGAGESQLVAPATQLGAGDPHEHGVQGGQRLVLVRTARTQRSHPVGMSVVPLDKRAGDADTGVAAVGSLGRWHGPMLRTGFTNTSAAGKTSSVSLH